MSRHGETTYLRHMRDFAAEAVHFSRGRIWTPINAVVDAILDVPQTLKAEMRARAARPEAAPQTHG